MAKTHRMLLIIILTISSTLLFYLSSFGIETLDPTSA